MSKPNDRIDRIMDIDERPKGRKGIDEMLERINEMDEDFSHSEANNKDIA